MVPYQITVSLVGPNRIRAIPNPSPVTPPPANPEDTVTWIFDESFEDTRLRVVFDQVRELPSGPPEPCSPSGPFDRLLPQLDPRRIVGIVRPDIPKGSSPIARYFYKILQNGIALDWENKLLDAPDLLNGGGIDTSGRPPGGG